MKFGTHVHKVLNLKLSRLMTNIFSLIDAIPAEFHQFSCYFVFVGEGRLEFFFKGCRYYSIANLSWTATALVPGVEALK